MRGRAEQVMRTDHHTDTRGASAFPRTRHSVLLAARDADPETRRRALDVLIAAYWRPVYAYLRLRWRLEREDAEDATQGFFADVLERGLLERYDPARARFRTYLRLCLDAYAANEHKAAARLKRGGHLDRVALDLERMECELARSGAVSPADAEALFDREWVRSIFTLAVDALRERLDAAGKRVHFELFRRYDLEGADAPDRPTYAQLAAEHGLPVTQVTNFLALARREFRRAVLETLYELCGSEEEFRAEARELLGVEAR